MKRREEEQAAKKGKKGGGGAIQTYRDGLEGEQRLHDEVVFVLATLPGD